MCTMLVVKLIMSLFHLRDITAISVFISISVLMVSGASLKESTTESQISTLNCKNYTIIKQTGVSFSLKCASFSNVIWYKNGEKYSVNGSHLEIQKQNKTSVENYICKRNNESRSQPGKCIAYKVYIVERIISTKNLYKNISTQEHENFPQKCSLNSDQNLPDAELKRIQIDLMKTEKSIPEAITIITKIQRENVTVKDKGWCGCVKKNESGIPSYFFYCPEVDKKQNAFIKIDTVFIIILGILFIGALMGILYVYYRLRNEKKKKDLALQVAQSALLSRYKKKIIIEKRYISDKISGQSQETSFVKIEHHQVTDAKNSTSPKSGFQIDLDACWEFPRENLQLAEGLGEGEFGKVVKAKALGILEKNVTTVVAAKMLKECYTDSDMVALVSEMEIMKMIGKHDHILRFLGCCSQDGSLIVITEYALHGNLRDFLRQSSLSLKQDGFVISNDEFMLTQKKLINFALQIAKGMVYLASIKCIHRDLAARNILVTDDYVLKISDFGLAKSVYDTDYYRKTNNGRLPIKWMAPEALFHRLHSIQSDVWSYGILLWEIMTLGGAPYPTITNMDKLLLYLRTGNRMEKPTNCPLQVYLMMRDCWRYVPNNRPTFTQIVDGLNELLGNNEEELGAQMNSVEFRPLSVIEECDVGEDKSDSSI